MLSRTFVGTACLLFALATAAIADAAGRRHCSQGLTLVDLIEDKPIDTTGQLWIGAEALAEGTRAAIRAPARISLARQGREILGGAEIVAELPQGLEIEKRREARFSR